jgi:hypothetical protein
MLYILTNVPIDKEHLMSNKTENIGSCLCGSVRVTVTSPNHNVAACHCSMCRRWGGGPLLALECGSDISIEGEENITTFDSSEWAERGFCKNCGTHIFYRFKGSQEYIIPVGLLDDENSFTLEHQIFIDRKPKFYSYANQTKNLTEAEVFKQYAPPQA